MVARRAHNPKVASSSLASATMNPVNQAFTGSFLVLWNGVEREFSVEKYKHESNAHQVVQQVKADDGTACPPNDVYQNGQAAAAAVLGIERRQPGPPGDSGEKLRKPTVPSLADGHQPIGGQLLQKEGKGYSTLTSIRGVVKPAFQMAYNEEVVRRNPFDFKLTDVVVNDSQKRISLTEKQQKVWMNFIREDKSYAKYYDEFVVLLGTGMRVSEFCGLTKADLDFAGRKIRVDHQLVRERSGKYYVEKTKTECGCRYIPMTDEVYRSLQNILSLRKRVKTETIIDGYSGFLLLDKNDSPKVALHIENEMRWAMKKYQKLHPDKPLPHITPHVFRHTFCTNMANAGMDIKALQYVMGHSDASITLNVYTHASYDHAAEQMAKLVDFPGSSDRQERKMSG